MERGRAPSLSSHRKRPPLVATKEIVYAKTNDEVKRLLSQGADPDTLGGVRIFWSMVLKLVEYNETKMTWACGNADPGRLDGREDFAIISTLIRGGANVHHKDNVM